MNNPFPNNPVFARFLGLKHYFREYGTAESVRRTQEITRIARIIQKSGDLIAFDILGSVNFGMADEKSDVDIVVYLDCGHNEEANYSNCPKLRFYEALVITSLVREISNIPFQVQTVDCINLGKLSQAIEKRDYEDDILARFVFYRTICRGVNKRILRKYEYAVQDDVELFKRIENSLTEALLEFTRTQGHRNSFAKYLSRLREMEVKIPSSVMEKVFDYLNSTPGVGQ